MEKSVGIVVTKVQTEEPDMGRLEKQKPRDPKLALQGTQHTQHEKREKEAEQ